MMTRNDLTTIRRMNKLARTVLGARGVPPSTSPATIARATKAMQRLGPAYTAAKERLGSKRPN